MLWSASGDLVCSPLNMKIAIGFLVVRRNMRSAGFQQSAGSEFCRDGPGPLTWYGAVVELNQRVLAFCFLDGHSGSSFS